MKTNHDVIVTTLAGEIMSALQKITARIAPEATTADVCSGLLLAASTTMFDMDNLPEKNPIFDMIGMSAVSAGRDDVGLLIGSIVAAFHRLHVAKEEAEMKHPAQSAMYN
jgi:hypothetical protein